MIHRENKRESPRGSKNVHRNERKPPETRKTMTKQKVYVIEKIGKPFRYRGIVYFPSKWLGYDHTHNTDEPYENIGEWQKVYRKDGKKRKRKRAKKQATVAKKKRAKKTKKTQYEHVAPRIGPQYQAVIPPYEGPYVAPIVRHLTL